MLTLLLEHLYDMTSNSFCSTPLTTLSGNILPLGNTLLAIPKKNNDKNQQEKKKLTKTKPKRKEKANVKTSTGVFLLKKQNWYYEEYSENVLKGMTDSLVVFYDISTFVGYLMPNPFLYKQTVLFQTIQFSISTPINCQNISFSNYSV